MNWLLGMCCKNTKRNEETSFLNGAVENHSSDIPTVANQRIYRQVFIEFELKDVAILSDLDGFRFGQNIISILREMDELRTLYCDPK